MEASKKFLKESGADDRISFKDNEAHTVKLIKDKEDSLPDKFGGTGGMVKGMKYLVEENGVQKTFFTSSLGLVSKLAEFNTGDIVTIQMKGKKVGNEFRSEFVVSKGDKLVEADDDGIVGDEEVAPTVVDW